METRTERYRFSFENDNLKNIAKVKELTQLERLLSPVETYPKLKYFEGNYKKKNHILDNMDLSTTKTTGIEQTIN